MIEYGITTSKADYWVHVCPLDASLYVYPRARMSQIIKTCQRVEIKSAIGHLVDIRNNLRANGGIITPIDLTYEFFRRYDWIGAESDSKIGEYSEAIFKHVADDGLLPQFPTINDRYNDPSDQFNGMDFKVTPKKPFFNYEVKSDIPGGIWGTGNLFVQTHEYMHQHHGRNAHKDTENVRQNI